MTTAVHHSSSTVPVQDTAMDPLNSDAYFTFSQFEDKEMTMAPYTPPTVPTVPTAESEEQYESPVRPSHDYALFKQQTGIPPGSLQSVIGPSQHANPDTSMSSFNAVDFDDGNPMDPHWDMGTTNLGMDINSMIDMSMNMVVNSAPPPLSFASTDAQQSSSFLNINALSSNEALPKRVYPGVHTANQEKQQRQQQQQLQLQQQLAAQQHQQQQQQQQLAAQQQGLPAQSSSFLDINAFSSNEAPPKRVYPGMHTANQKKQQQRQQQLQQQQQMAAQQQQQPQQQQQQQLAVQQQRLPAQQQSHGQSTGNVKETDPRTEEVISRVLTNMRRDSQHSSPASQHDMESPMPHHVMRMKKEEADMDEDERLLLSEEGKKLSAKERRQLRNKVSARAFRSRRKEYISQLEAQIADTHAQSTRLRDQNAALMQENASYQQFISHMMRLPAFQPYLEDMSRFF
jgi:hypothetical protein